ncbi:MAG: ABC transporter ATP-binding protein [Spirochaetales bacterium]|nr:ABC transporter ATP-binding protein [Spirochaetales bacterium]
MDKKETETSDLKLERLCKSFGKVQAVREVSLEIPHGKLITLLGPSGCGKTTILRMIAGLEVPSSGKIYLGGDDITELPPNERKITMVFQSYALFPHMNVYENIAYGLKVKHVHEEKVRAAVKESLEMVGLGGLEKRGSAELSGGQQQRVAVARALVLKPKVLLFDEPLSNLDAKLRNRMRGEIRNLQRDLGITSVYVTHDQSEALAMSDKIVVMENAVISQEGKPTELYRQPANEFVADFIGDANIVEAKVLDVKNSKAHIEIDKKDFYVAYKSEPKPGETAKIMIRPEDISLQNESADGIKAMVEFALYQGSTNDYLVKTNFGELRIRDFTNKEVLRERGTYISLNFREDQIFLIH